MPVSHDRTIWIAGKDFLGSDGPWSTHGTLITSGMDQTFAKTRWFVPVGLLVTILVVLGLYRLLLSKLSARIRDQLEERTQERERIAQELHDTLLQGVQGLILRFQAAADRACEDGSMDELEAALDAADKVVMDARERVWDLRRREAAADLFERVEQLVAQTPFDPPVLVRIVLEGRLREVDPAIAVEIAKIVSEALLNISYHAHARIAEIVVAFDARYLVIRMRDDGCGIPAHTTVDSGTDGRFGLAGMHARAARIGGSLKICSIGGSGTEVLLTLPAKLAFARRKTRHRYWLSDFLRR